MSKNQSQGHQVIDIIRATYVKAYVLRLEFSDGSARNVDFEPFMRNSYNVMNSQFLDPAAFQKFSLKYGILSWEGEAGEMDFNADHLPDQEM